MTVRHEQEPAASIQPPVSDVARSTQGEPVLDPATDMWESCRRSPGTFEHWMKLIPHLEKAGEQAQGALKMAYEEFLATFPLCYG